MEPTVRRLSSFIVVKTLCWGGNISYFTDKRILVRTFLLTFALCLFLSGCKRARITLRRFTDYVPQHCSDQPDGSNLHGRRFAVQGDSISALFNNSWQNVVIQRTGMILVSQDARGGRGFATTFECWGNPSIGDSPIMFHASFEFPGYPGATCGQEAIGISDGMSFADSLKNVDLLIIELSSSDQRMALGALGDSVTAGTFYGNMRWVLETYLKAKPTLRVVMVTAEYNSAAPPQVTQRYVDAMLAYGNSMGIPVVNMFALSGVNSLTSAVYTRDGVHPSHYHFVNNYGPVIAQAVMQVY